MTMQTANLSEIHSTFDRYFTNGDFEQIIVEGQVLLESATRNNDSEKIRLSYLLLIKAYYYLGDIQKAYENVLYYQQLIEKVNRMNDDFNLHYVQAHIYEYEKNFNKVQQAVEKCIAIATRSQDYSQLCRIKIFNSNFLLTNGHLERALEEAQLAKNMMQLHEIQNLQLNFRCQLLIASATERLYKDSQLFNDLHVHPAIHQNPFERCRLFYTKALNNIYNEDWDLALINFHKANVLAHQQNALLMQIRIVQHSVTVYEHLTSYKEAFEAMKQLNELKETFYKTVMASRAIELNIIHNIEKIKARANIDPLSGVYNRYYLEERAGELLEEAMIQDDHICCMVFDVDNFKAINDTYGHLVGDEVIKMLGQTCNDVLKDSEAVVARYGGDEFVILSKSYGEQDVIEKSQRLFDTITNTTVSVKNMSLTISISMGIVCNKIIPTILFSTLFHSADQALYSAKRQGKNQIVYVADLNS
ncbi:MAG: diguanylate cyclase [Solibacillus sp.]